MRSCLPTRDGYCLHDRDPRCRRRSRTPPATSRPSQRGGSKTKRSAFSSPGKGTPVTTLHLGYTDNPMTAGLDVPKNEPTDVAAHPYSDARAGGQEALAHDVLHQVKAGLSGPIEQLYLQLASTRRGERS
jgi:hypothetical protein